MPVDALLAPEIQQVGVARVDHDSDTAHRVRVALLECDPQFSDVRRDCHEVASQKVIVSRLPPTVTVSPDVMPGNPFGKSLLP